jgi:hypothetical protein
MVKVAQVANGKPVKFTRQAREADLKSFNDGATRLDQCRIGRNAEQTRHVSTSRKTEEASTIKPRLVWRRNLARRWNCALPASLS